MNIAVFYHCLFYWRDPIEPIESAFIIVSEQMLALKASGLLDAADRFIVGINGGAETVDTTNLFFPRKTERIYHGLESKSENMTIEAMHKWALQNPGWAVFYHHAQGSGHSQKIAYSKFVANWRKAMTEDLVMNWRQCVKDLESGYESVGCHFMRNVGDGTHNIWAGNFFWVTSDFLATLTPISERQQCKISGLASKEARYESEMWLGNGKRLPRVKEYKPVGGNGVP